MNIKSRIRNICLIISLLSILSPLGANVDWPIYKGNLYFTGNNDEIVVKGNRIRWIFEGEHTIHNPIISNGRIYFSDQRKNIFCLDEETGQVIWKINLQKISRSFATARRNPGKIKYPLIKGDRLFLSDSSVIYCLNKNNGSVIWARTGMRNETKLGRFSRARVDGIYSDPIIADDTLVYGTRRVFMARGIRHGHLLWKNDAIRSYSSFPTFYDKYIFTQSRSYRDNTYFIYCLIRRTGQVIWKAEIQKPFKILAPVVYKGKVYFPSGKKLYALDLKTGNVLWIKEYGGVITSSPSFTDREIIFTLNNQQLAFINPNNGEIKHRKNTPYPSSLKYVTIRDQLYLARTEYRNIQGRKMPFTLLTASPINKSTEYWNFRTPFRGEPSQPVASKGVLFLPAGNYLYALGKNPTTSKTTEDYIKKVKKGKTEIKRDKPLVDIVKKKSEPFNKKLVRRKDPTKAEVKKIVSRTKKNNSRLDKKKIKKQIPMRPVKINVMDKNKRLIEAVVTIKKRHNGRVVYKKTVRVTPGKNVVHIPDDDNVEVLVEKPGYLPNKVIVNRKDKKKDVVLTKIQRGEKLSLTAIKFEVNRAYLKPQSLDFLDQMIRVLKQQRGLRLKIFGHTDSSGPDRYNQTLSEKRAEVIREYMIKNGISPERLTARGFGESRPVASNKNRAGRAKNRRTEFLVE